MIRGAALAVTLTVQPLVNDADFLEPSVQNEVDHAIVRGERFLATATNAAPAAVTGPQAATNAVGAVAVPSAWTNAASRTQTAIRLVSAQKSDGSWRAGTNDVTRAVLDVLRAL